MAKCWRFYGRGTSPPYDSQDYEFFACGTLPEYRQATVGQFPGVNLYMDGIALTDPNYQYGSNHSVVAVADSTPTPGFTSSGSCGNCRASSYDCLNGNCIENTVYKTPGIFKSKEDCDSACGGGARCDGVCLDKDEAAKIKALAGDIKGKVCP